MCDVSRFRKKINYTNLYQIIVQHINKIGIGQKFFDLELTTLQKKAIKRKTTIKTIKNQKHP